MLEKKPAVMITAAINSTILLPCLKRANELKIPVADLDGNLDPEITKKAGVDVAFHIGSDNEAAGAKGADYLVSVLGKDAKGPVLVIEGLSGNITGAEARARLRRRAEEGGARARHRRLAARRLGQPEGRQHHQRHAAAQPRPRRRSSAPTTTWRSARWKRRARRARTS